MMYQTKSSLRKGSQHTQSIYSKLSPAQLVQCLQSMDVFRKMLDQITLSSRKQILNKIFRILKYIEVYDEDVIYKKGQSSKQIYLIVWGSVGAYLQGNIQQQQIRIFKQNQGFGEAQAITHTKRIFTTRARQNTCLGMIRSNDFQQILSDYRDKVYLKKYIKFSQNYLFKGFSKSQLQFIVHNTKQLNYLKNQIIYAQNTQSDCIYLIQKGQVKLLKNYINNKKHIEICTIEDNSLLGQIQVILNKNRQHTAISHSQYLIIYEIHKKIFFSQFNQNMLEQIISSIKQKNQIRQIRYDRFIKTRLRTQKNTLERSQSCFNKNKKNRERLKTTIDENQILIVQQQYKNIGEKFYKNLEFIIEKKKNLLQKNYGILLNKKTLTNKNFQFFIVEKQVRPKILLRKSQVPTSKNESIQAKKSIPKSSISQITHIRKITQIQQKSIYKNDQSLNTIKFPIIKIQK